MCRVMARSVAGTEEEPLKFDPKTTQLDPTPILRDTVTIRPFGYLVVRFVTDNPGAWIFHCHIDWCEDISSFTLPTLSDLQTSLRLAWTTGTMPPLHVVSILAMPGISNVHPYGLGVSACDSACVISSLLSVTVHHHKRGGV